MNPHVQRATDTLNRALRDLSVRRAAVRDDERVALDVALLQELTSSLAFVEGGSRTSFVRALVARPGPEGVSLSPDEAHHLARALEDIAREDRRRRDLDRGIVRGPLSGAEASRLARKFPGMFR